MQNERKSAPGKGYAGVNVLTLLPTTTKSGKSLSKLTQHLSERSAATASSRRRPVHSTTFPSPVRGPAGQAESHGRVTENRVPIAKPLTFSLAVLPHTGPYACPPLQCGRYCYQNMIFDCLYCLTPYCALETPRHIATSSYESRLSTPFMIDTGNEIVHAPICSQRGRLPNSLFPTPPLCSG